MKPAASGQPGGRTETTPARFGTEAIRETMGRLQNASLQMDYDKQTAKATHASEKHLEEIKKDVKEAIKRGAFEPRHGLVMAK
jgi:hypothetical protein